jgi:hypothetical protein
VCKACTNICSRHPRAPDGRFTRAIQQRNLLAAEASTRELGSVSLEGAPAYLDLLADAGGL